MPQRSVTTSTPNGYTIATLQALVTALQASMQSGSDIVASQIISIKTGFYDLWRTHTHTAQDRTGIDTFGNLTVYGVGGTHLTPSTGVPQSNTQPSYITPTFAAGNDITAADINGMILIVNNMRVHNHIIDDQIGATAPVVAIADATYTALAYVATATATLTLQNNGTLVGADAGAIGGQWINMRPTDVATAAAYDVRVTHTGGSVPSGTLNTWLNLGTSRAWSISAPYVGGLNTVSSTILVEIRDAASLVVVDSASITLSATSDDLPPPPTCFPANSLVLMGDGSWKKIQNVRAGDMVMGMTGPVPVIQMDAPLLGSRKMLKFADESLYWSEEHAMWTRNADQSQWWWSFARDTWLREVQMGAIGGLTDNQSMRTGDQVAEWAHLTGWKTNEVVVVDGASLHTRLYLPRTEGSPIIVNGYVVGAGVNQAGFDYSQLDWDAVRASLPVVQPLPLV